MNYHCSKAYSLFIFLIVFSVCINAQDTERLLYRPFAETDKHPALFINRTLHGTCVEQSYLIKREDAWRCSVGNKVYDPCFTKQFDKDIKTICPHSPWSHKAVAIVVEKPLDNKNHSTLDMSRTYPWSLELDNGIRCMAASNNLVYEGLPIRYRCESGEVLVGPVQRCAAFWKIIQSTSDGMSTVGITKAWF